MTSLAWPLNRIFDTVAEAEIAFDLLAQTAHHLQIEGAYDPRLAVTLSDRSLHLDYGGWLILGFRRPQRVSVALLASQTAFTPQERSFTFSTTADEPAVHSYEVPFSRLNPPAAAVLTAFEQTLDFVLGKFEHWQSTPYRRYHKPEVAEALFDPAKRARLFAEGLPEPHLSYEPHRTPFALAVGEENADYEIGEKSMTSPLPYTFTDLANDTLLDEATLKQWLRAIKRKRQIILYGPPGTGKTYLAERLARHLVLARSGVQDLVQFHPSYNYEDFIEGLRPQVDERGQLRYEMVAGRFVQFCELAEETDAPCVLIIDEINRANLSTVFGELMYLLEYREQTVTLSSGRRFSIPANVILIGTMNTADRSVALVDHALRRRFAFLHVRPNFEVLRRYHQTHETEFDPSKLISLLTRLNSRIADPAYEIGVSFFLHEEVATDLELIWRTEIEPYLEEFFFDQLDELAEFRWERVRVVLD